MTFSLQSVVDFFDHPFFIVVGGISTLALSISAIAGIVAAVRGFGSVWLRLGRGLVRRKIAIFADQQAFSELESMLVDSGLFSRSNIECIPKTNLVKAKSFSLYLVNWDSGYPIDDVLAARANHHTAVVIYAKPQTISHPVMERLGDEPNVVVSNTKGRLLNDITTALITTAYDS